MTTQFRHPELTHAECRTCQAIELKTALANGVCELCYRDAAEAGALDNYPDDPHFECGHDLEI